MSDDKPLAEGASLIQHTDGDANPELFGDCEHVAPRVLIGQGEQRVEYTDTYTTPDGQTHAITWYDQQAPVVLTKTTMCGECWRLRVEIVSDLVDDRPPPPEPYFHIEDQS